MIFSTLPELPPPAHDRVAASKARLAALLHPTAAPVAAAKPARKPAAKPARKEPAPVSARKPNPQAALVRAMPLATLEFLLNGRGTGLDVARLRAAFADWLETRPEIRRWQTGFEPFLAEALLTPPAAAQEVPRAVVSETPVPYPAVPEAAPGEALAARLARLRRGTPVVFPA